MTQTTPLKKLNLGDRFPEFNLLDQDKKNNSLNDLMGQGIVITFLPKLTSPICRDHILSLEEDQVWLSRLNITLVGICSDLPEKLFKFSEEYFISFPLLFDQHSKLAAAVGALEEKEFLGKKFFTVNSTYFFLSSEKIIRSIADASGSYPQDWFKVLHQTMTISAELM